MIVLDTSVLIEALGRGGRLADALRGAIEAGERIVIPTLVLYEWLRGPRVAEELDAQEVLFPAADAVDFGPREAGIAAELYRSVDQPRGREVDLAIAACTISWDGRLWTLNRSDFEDVPGLELHRGPTST